MTDREIIDLFFARSEAAIAALREKYGRLCRRIAWNILHSDEDAEECESDTYLRVWETVPPSEPDPMLPYVGRIARNLALDRYRYNHAARRAAEDGGSALLDEIAEIVTGGESAEDAAAQRALSDAISAFLHEQTKDDRTLFVRRYWYGDDVASLAKSRGIPANAAAVKLHRIRERLRKYLAEGGINV